MGGDKIGRLYQLGQCLVPEVSRGGGKGETPSTPMTSEQRGSDSTEPPSSSAEELTPA
ncbi:hypothetical protein NQZ68_032730 [Dissostichus eleginoides]|nr:hypothetical protein NQZ68_032730 [Dissostichus eleginoides]